MSTVRIDLHTHSTGSPDGGLTIADYTQALAKGLDYIAITDHDTIQTAQEFQKVLGSHIIVGQEVSTADGEIIGLFLTQRVEPGLSAEATIQAIHNQGGLVYIPHPFETVRKGMHRDVLDRIAESVDIIEIFNGRAVFQNKGPQAHAWARIHNVVGCASSDAHGKKGVGTSFTTIASAPTAQNLVKQLALGRPTTVRPPLSSLLYPKLNRIRGKIQKRS